MSCLILTHQLLRRLLTQEPWQQQRRTRGNFDSHSCTDICLPIVSSNQDHAAFFTSDSGDSPGDVLPGR